MPRRRQLALPLRKSQPYDLRVLGRVSDVPQPVWDALVGDAGSPFMEHRWLALLEETGCVGEGTGWMPLHLSLWQSDELLAVAPAYLKEHSEGEFVFDWSWAEFSERLGTAYYPKIVASVPFTPASGERVLTAPGVNRTEAIRVMADAARELCGRTGCSGVHVLFPREDEATCWQERGYLLREGFQFHWFRHGATTFDEYLARFSSKHRNQIKRELRGVRDAGIVVDTLTSEAHTHEIARTMYGFYAATIDKHGMWGRRYLNERFFLALTDRFRDRLAWVVARDASSGRILGGAFNITKGRRLYGRYWGAAVDVPFLHFVVCYYAGIRHAIERGVDVFEPGAGGEHKRPRGFVPTVTYSNHWVADPRLRAALIPWLGHERARVRALVGSAVTDP